jgi:hypothetical protein
MEEIWKDVVGYKDYFSISNYGNLLAKERMVNKGEGFFLVKEHPVKPFVTKCGYLQYNLAINGTVKKKYAHRLVAEAFIPKVDNKFEINHIDGNKKNNFVENLEWCNRKENMRHFSNKYQTEQNNRKTLWEKSNGGVERIYTFCPICGNKMSINSLVCKKCKKYNRKSLLMPDRDVLKDKIKCGNFTKVAKEYGVTDNSVRKWCIKYNMPTSSKIIRETSSDGWDAENWGDSPKNKKQNQNKSVYIILSNGDYILFKNISSGINFAKLYFGLEYDRNKVNTSHVSDVCNGIRKTAYGFVWKWEK